MPILKNPSKRGDLYIQFKINFPTVLTTEIRDQLVKILPPPTTCEEKKIKDDDLPQFQEVALVDGFPPSHKEAEATQQREIYEEDDQSSQNPKRQQCQQM